VLFIPQTNVFACTCDSCADNDSSLPAVLPRSYFTFFLILSCTLCYQPRLLAFTQWIWSEGSVRLEHGWVISRHLGRHRREDAGVERHLWVTREPCELSWRGHREGSDAKTEAQPLLDTRGKFQIPVTHVSRTSSWSRMLLWCLLLKPILRAAACCIKSL